MCDVILWTVINFVTIGELANACVCDVQMLQTVKTLFSKKLAQGKSSDARISQLLVILSDGRGVFANGTLVSS